jgi:hypothetical protein
MKSGKIILMVFIVFASAVGVATFHELGFNDNNPISIDDFSFQDKTVKIELSDGAGSSSDTG